MKPIDSAGFEAMFRVDVDPWNYAASPFEAFKRGILLRSCGTGCRGRVLELACANGETTKALMRRSLRLLAVDGAPSAIAEAQRRIGRHDRVALRTALLPGEMPRGPFDLIVVSELLYYLKPNALRLLLPKLAAATAPGGRIVLLHHLKSFTDVSQPPPLVHAAAAAHFRRGFVPLGRQRHGAFEAMLFERRR